MCCGSARGRSSPIAQQPDVARLGRAVRRAVLPLGGGRGERGRCHARPRRRFRRRRQRRADRSARGLRPRQLRRHGPAAGRDGRAADDDQPTGRRVAALRDRQDEDLASAAKSSPPRSMPWKSISPTPPATGSTACGSTGPAAGFWSAAATPSRSSAPLPKRRRRRRPSRCAKRRRRCWQPCSVSTVAVCRSTAIPVPRASSPAIPPRPPISSISVFSGRAGDQSKSCNRRLRILIFRRSSGVAAANALATFFVPTWNRNVGCCHEVAPLSHLIDRPSPPRGQPLPRAFNDREEVRQLPLSEMVSRS